MYASIEMELARNAATADAIRVLLDWFGDGEFTSREGRDVLRKFRECAQFDTLNNNNWFEVSRVEYFDLPTSARSQGRRYYYSVRKDYAQKMAREFVREDDVDSAMRRLRNKMADLDAEYETLKALKALHFDSED